MQSLQKLSTLGLEQVGRNRYLQGYIQMGEVGPAEVVAEESLCSSTRRSIFTYRAGSTEVVYYELEGRCLEVLRGSGQLEGIMEGLVGKLERRMQYLVCKVELQHFKSQSSLQPAKQGKEKHKDHSFIHTRKFPQFPSFAKDPEPIGHQAAGKTGIKDKSKSRIEIFSKAYSDR